MAEFDDLTQAAIALHGALKNLDRIQNELAKSLKTYAAEGNKTACRIIEEAAKFRRELGALDSFLHMRRGKLRRPGMLFLVLPRFFKLGDAPIAWVRLIRRLADHGIGHAQACDTAELLYRKTHNLFVQKQKMLMQAFTKRYAQTIDVKKTNPRLSGKVTVRVQFSSHIGIDEAAKAGQFPEALDEVVRAIGDSGLGAEAYFSVMAETVFLAVKYLLRDFPDALTSVLGVPLRAEIIMIILPMKHGFGLFQIGMRWGRKELLGVEAHGRRIRVFFSFGGIAWRLAGKPPEHVAYTLSGSLAHEFTHALDKRFRETETVFDHIRVEGIANFTEILSYPAGLDKALQTSSLKIWASEEELFQDTEKDRELSYVIGLVMCLGILCLYLKREKNYPTNPYHQEEMMALLSEPQFKNLIGRTRRQILAMNTATFFAVYQKAVAEGVAPKLFSEELLAEIA